MTREQFENAIHRKLLEFGWRVQRAAPAPHGWESHRTYWTAAYLRRHGFRPRTVIDVGVGHGTPELYAAFPGAFLVLVEPLEEFEPDVREILSGRPGIHIAAAAGASCGEREIRVESVYAERSSLYERLPPEDSGDPASRRRLNVVTLDSVMDAHRWAAPMGLKIDAEGAELEILEGATATLAHCEFVIAEVSLLPRFQGGYGLSGFIAVMDRAGFCVCDVLGLGRASTGELTYLDMLFQRGDRRT